MLVCALFNYIGFILTFYVCLALLINISYSFLVFLYAFPYKV
jgi:hypothetical protein